MVIYHFQKKVCKFEMSYVTSSKFLSIREYKISTLLKVPFQKHRHGPFDERSLLCSSTVLYSGTDKIHRPDGVRSTAVEMQEWRRCSLQTLDRQCLEKGTVVPLYIVVIATW
jgi:hypothetical protein